MLRNSEDREVEYLQHDEDRSLGMKRERLFSIQGRPAPKYWLDPRWKKYRELLATHREHDAEQLASQIRIDWRI